MNRTAQNGTGNKQAVVQLCLQTDLSDANLQTTTLSHNPHLRGLA